MPRYKGIPNKLKGTPALKELYKHYVRPFLDRYHLHEEQRELKEGVEAFFMVSARPITWYKAMESFTLPGMLWESTSRPHRLTQAAGRRLVKTGSSVVVRQEIGREDYIELEFDNQVFVLTEVQFKHIEANLKARA